MYYVWNPLDDVDQRNVHMHDIFNDVEVFQDGVSWEIQGEEFKVTNDFHIEKLDASSSKTVNMQLATNKGLGVVFDLE